MKEKLAVKLYQAYSKASYGKDTNGIPLPTWEHLRPSMKFVWEAVAEAALKEAPLKAVKTTK